MALPAWQTNLNNQLSIRHIAIHLVADWRFTLLPIAIANCRLEEGAAGNIQKQTYFKRYMMLVLLALLINA